MKVGSLGPCQPSSQSMSSSSSAIPAPSSSIGVFIGSMLPPGPVSGMDSEITKHESVTYAYQHPRPCQKIGDKEFHKLKPLPLFRIIGPKFQDQARLGRSPSALAQKLWGSLQICPCLASRTAQVSILHDVRCIWLQGMSLKDSVRCQSSLCEERCNYPIKVTM